METLYTVSQVAKETGVTIKTLHYYQKSIYYYQQKLAKMGIGIIQKMISIFYKKFFCIELWDFH